MIQITVFNHFLKNNRHTQDQDFFLSENDKDTKHSRG